MDEFLKGLDLFTDEAQHTFVSLLTEKRLEIGSVLFEYDEPSEKLYFLKDGHLAVYKTTGFHQKMQVIALLDPGTVVGEAALLQSQVRKTRITAIEESRLFCLERKDFLRFQKAFPENALRFLEHLLTIVSLRLEKTSERLARIL